CGGGLNPMQYGRLAGTGTPSGVASIFSAETPLNGTPQPFGRYLLRRELGRGGMGIVWEALDTDLGRPVALKMLLASGEEMEGGAVERLLREARAAARLRHPGIVGILDIGQADGRHYFTMDMVPGKSFEKLLRGPGLPERFRLEVVAAVAEALGAAHREGIVHRDVKPSNIIVDSNGRPVLVDFGLARDGAAGGNALTLTGALIGTLHYMSPEQACRAPRSASPPSDVFSLGVVLFRALTGHLPFLRDDAQLLVAILQEEPPTPSRINAEISRDLDTICLKCLEKNPDRRYPDGSALAADLRRYLAGTPIEASPVSRTRRFFRRLFGIDGSGVTADLRKAEEERVAVAERAQAQLEALKKLERARPALEQARQILYDREATGEDLLRRVDAAQSLIEQALARCPDLALGYYLLGRALMLRGHDDRAEEALRRAIQLDPDFGPAHFHLGGLVVEAAIFEFLSWPVEERVLHAGQMRKRLADGEVQLARALLLGRGFEDVARLHLASAMGACARDDKARAAELCREGITNFPRAEGREIYHWLLGFCAADPYEQVHGFDGALEVRPRFAPALAARGNAMALLARWSEALPDLDESIRLKPRNTPAVISRGLIRSRIGDLEGARADLEEGVSLRPDSPSAWQGRGAVRALQGDWRGAKADFEESLKRQPDFAAARSGLDSAMCELSAMAGQAGDGNGRADSKRAS
ncbi:MAG: protein kinase, partial [Planctomycetes bacterium]|nr:protein kinase [Planctomycetota bacterium]